MDKCNNITYFTWFVSIRNRSTPADHQSIAWLYGSERKISGAI